MVINLTGLMTDGVSVDSTYLQDNVTFTSSDEAVAIVNGLEIETLQPGTVTITATLDGKQASFTIIIT